MNAQNSNPQELKVDYVLATHPELEFQAKLQQVASRSSLSDEHGTAVQLTASIDPSHLPERRIGAEVSAKIHCGQECLAYVLFGDLVEFVQLRVW